MLLLMCYISENRKSSGHVAHHHHHQYQHHHHNHSSQWCNTEQLSAILATSLTFLRTKNPQDMLLAHTTLCWMLLHEQMKAKYCQKKMFNKIGLTTFEARWDLSKSREHKYLFMFLMWYVKLRFYYVNALLTWIIQGHR